MYVSGVARPPSTQPAFISFFDYFLNAIAEKVTYVAGHPCGSYTIRTYEPIRTYDSNVLREGRLVLTQYPLWLVQLVHKWGGGGVNCNYDATP